MGRRFTEHTDEQIVEAMLAALAKKLAYRLRTDASEPEVIDWQSFWNQLVEEPGMKSGSSGPHLHPSEKSDIHAAFWRLVSLGYIVPLFVDERSVAIASLVITQRGRAALEATADDPRSPSYLARLAQEHPMREHDRGKDVLARLEDASDCLTARLHRPAIVMVRVAAEVTLEAAIVKAKTLGLAIKNEAKAAFQAKLDALMGWLPNWGDNDDQKRRLRVAVVAIENFRSLGNEGAHAGKPTIDPNLARDQFGSACLQLPVVWDLLVLKQPP